MPSSMEVEGAGDYALTVGSDIVRDGMFLEMRDAAGTCVAEVFYSDVTHKMAVTMQGHALPIEAVEALLSQARRRLPPSQVPGAAP